MVTYNTNTPKLALGEMAMDLNKSISVHMPELLTSNDGIKKVVPLLLQLDGLLSAYRKYIKYQQWLNDPTNPEMVELVSYWIKRKELHDRMKGMSFYNTSDQQKWMMWIWEYIDLLSSCYNVIGLAPATIKVTNHVSKQIIQDNPDWANNAAPNEGVETEPI